MDERSRGIPAAFQKGQSVGHYQIIEVLTSTRFGHTYLGQHKAQPLHVLIEGLLPPLLEEYTAAFLQGAQALKRLEHPHILAVRDLGVQQQSPFLVTDYYPYRTFSQVYAPKSPHSLMLVLPHLKQIASALDYAHCQQIVHGDLRPENILLGANDTVLLRGFLLEAIMRNRGRLTYRGEDAAEHEALLYAAPEQIQGNAGVASDQYALGVLIYELLSGKAPFSGSAVEIAFQKIHASAPALRRRAPQLISPGVEQVVMQALEKEPERRFPDVQAFIAALEQAYHQPQPNQSHPTQLRYHELSPTHPPKNAGAAPPPVAPPLQGVAPMPISPPGGPPGSPLRPVPQEFKRAAPEQLTLPSEPSTRHQKGVSVTRRVFAAGLVGIAALGGVSGWYLLSRRFAQAALPLAYAQTGVPATQITVNHQQGLIFTGHLAGVNALAWSPDGKFIASASDDTFVQVFEAATGTRKLIYRGHTEEVASVAWSPGGRLIASAGQDRTVQVWDVVSGGSPVLTYTGHTDRVNSVVWSSGGHLLASGSDDKSVQVWQASSGVLAFTFLGHTAGVLCVGWQPDQSSVASGSWDGALCDWATVQHGDHFNAGDQIFNYGGHGNNAVYALSWSPDGKFIASAGADQTIQISNGVDGTPRPPFFTDHRRSDHTNRVFAVSWSPDGTSIASGDEDGNVYVWKMADRKTFFRYSGHQGAVNALAWSPDGKLIASASADATVHVWRPE